MTVLVTGSTGQLGQALQYISGSYSAIQFYFAESGEGDVTDKDKLSKLFNKIKPDYCINAAAYTAVDKAESEPEQAFAVNVTGAKNLAEICKHHSATLIHVSTDFVFDGNGNIPYTEEDSTHPASIYGKTKLQGEQQIEAVLIEHYIIRTSWLYSQFGNNFMKTMLRVAKERTELNVVNDQTGTPTNAIDLAEAILQMISLGKGHYGTYHYSNEGETTWYGFAKKIFEINDISISVNPIPTSAYPTPAQRPAYSVLDKSKIKRTFGVNVSSWEDSLAKCTYTK
jgi:dTDP-4-dehydrorhamnose reductase